MLGELLLQNLIEIRYVVIIKTCQEISENVFYSHNITRILIFQDGKSRGHAVIEYDHPVEAVQAISMFNNQSLYDRKITVS